MKCVGVAVAFKRMSVCVCVCLGAGLRVCMPVVVSRSHGWQIDHEGSPSSEAPGSEECAALMQIAAPDTVNVALTSK